MYTFLIKKIFYLWIGNWFMYLNNIKVIQEKSRILLYAYVGQYFYQLVYPSRVLLGKNKQT